MSMLTDENIKFIFDRLEEKIKTNAGVKVCIQQGSENFENWVQVELCHILTLPPIGQNMNNIDVEKRVDFIAPFLSFGRDNGSIDIVINENGKMRTAIEIKIIKLGREGFYRTDRIQKDIARLGNMNNCDRALLCIVYNTPRGKKWTELTDSQLMPLKKGLRTIGPRAMDLKDEEGKNWVEVCIELFQLSTITCCRTSSLII